MSLVGKLKGNQKVFADPPAQIVDSLEELGQIQVQAVLEDVVDAAIAQLGTQQPGAPLGSSDRLLRTIARLADTSFTQLASERGISLRRISNSATRDGVITSR